MRWLIPFLVIVSVIGVVLWLDDPMPDHDLVILRRGDVYTLDPQRMTYLRDLQMAYAIYEGLLRWDPETFQPVPAAAAAMPEVSDDGRTHRFRLRRDARWSNGDPVTAPDFAYAWRRALLPELASYYSSMLFIIEGAEDFFNWRAAELSERGSSREADSAVEHWHRAKQRFDETVGIRVIDEYTLEVRLREPIAYFHDLVCFATFAPVHRPSVEGWQVDHEMRRTMRDRGWHAVDPPPFHERRWMHLNETTGRLETQSDWCKGGRLVSNGPLALNRWRFRRDMHLIPNEHYHSPEIIRSGSILIRTVEDANTAILAYETGRVDWLSEVGAEYRADMLAEREAYEARHQQQIEAMMAAGLSMDALLAALPDPKRGERRNLHAFPAFGTDFYAFNCRPQLPGGRANPLADARVRRAFVFAIDRERIVRNVTRLNEPLATTFVPRDAIPGYRSPEGIGHDPTRAREELRAAGWFDRNGDGMITNEAGERFPVVEILWTTNTPRYRWISLELKDQWERVLGVQVELRGVDTRFYREDLSRGNFMIARRTWYGDYGDPTTFLNTFRSNDGNNHGRFADETIDAMLSAADAERDPKERLAMLADIEEVLFQEHLPVLTICQLLQFYMYEPGRLSGLSHHPRLVQYLWRLERTSPQVHQSTDAQDHRPRDPQSQEGTGPRTDDRIASGLLDVWTDGRLP